VISAELPAELYMSVNPNECHSAAAERGEEIASPRAGQVEHISTVMTFREFLLNYTRRRRRIL